MLSDALTALRQTFSPLLRGILIKSILLAAGLLIVLAIGFNVALDHVMALPYPWLETTLSVIAGLGSLIVALYLMPAVSSLVAGLFLDDVAAAVERASYPHQPPGVAPPMARAARLSARFFSLALLVNLMALLLLLVPGLNLVFFFLSNAYLLSREYFELAALRHAGLEQARALRRAQALKVFIAGLIMTLLLMVPILNLILPVFGTAFMVHVHKRLTTGARPEKSPA